MVVDDLHYVDNMVTICSYACTIDIVGINVRNSVKAIMDVQNDAKGVKKLDLAISCYVVVVACTVVCCVDMIVYLVSYVGILIIMGIPDLINAADFFIIDLLIKGIAYFVGTDVPANSKQDVMGM